jgi:5-dehydro-2-deoxygluconokinase
MTGGRERTLDIVCIGRTCVDLYAEQEGARLEDVQSFRKYVGGSAANIALNTARLGVKTAMLTRVGEEQMGRFVRSTMHDTGVDVSHVTFDPEHLTPYVLLAVRDVEDFPRIFAYGDAADMALDESDVDPEFISSSGALLVTGTPLSRSGSRSASFKAVRAAREAGSRVLFDLDYRPVFWGVARMRPRRGDGGRGPDSRRLLGYPRSAPRHPRALRRDDRAEGGRDGGHRVSR